MTARRRFATFVAAPLLVGASVYLFLRPTEAWFVRMLGDAAIGGVLRAVRAVTVPFGARLPAALLDVAPDFAWAFVVGAFLALIWSGRPGAASRGWFVAGLATSVAYEIAQRFHTVPGTFDPLDLVAQTLGYCAGWWSQSHFFALNQRTIPAATHTIRPIANG